MLVSAVPADTAKCRLAAPTCPAFAATNFCCCTELKWAAVASFAVSVAARLQIESCSCKISFITAKSRTCKNRRVWRWENTLRALQRLLLNGDGPRGVGSSSVSATKLPRFAATTKTLPLFDDGDGSFLTDADLGEG